jgi:hypothetical protein
MPRVREGWGVVVVEAWKVLRAWKIRLEDSGRVNRIWGAWLAVRGN